MQQLFTSIAQQGYVLQALATTAGMLERGNAAAFIGADEESRDRVALARRSTLFLGA
jgi:uncharacterized protein YaaQ